MLPYAHYNHHGTVFTSTWQRYSSLKALARKIIDVALPVVFHSGIPHTTFTVVNLDTFDFATTQPLPLPTPGQQKHAAYAEDIDLEIEDEVIIRKTEFTHTCLVNGRPSCGFHIHCTLPPKNGSRFCFHHRRLSARTIIGLRGDTAPKEPQTCRMFGTYTRQTDVTFNCPEGVQLQEIKLLHRIFEKYEVWTIDVEFANVGGVRTLSLLYSQSEMQRQTISLFYPSLITIPCH